MNNYYSEENNKAKIYPILIIVFLIIITAGIVLLFIPKGNDIEIVILEKGSGSLSLGVVSSVQDIYEYNWNNEGFSDLSEYIVEEPGIYTLVVRDYNLNESKVLEIEITEKDLDVKLSGDDSNLDGEIIETPKEEPSDPQENMPSTPNEQKKEIITVKIVENGAIVSATEITCEKTGNSCEVVLPTITRENWQIVGFGESSSAKTTKYKSGDKISVTENKILYVITKRTFQATFNKNGATAVAKGNEICTIYNKETSCDVTLPQITRSGYTILGYDTSASATTAKYKV